MTRAKRISLITLAILYAATATYALIGGGYDLTWNTFDGGGGTSTGGGYEVSGTIGQPDASAADAMTGGTYSLTGGFWGGISETVACTRTIAGRYVFYNNSFYDSAASACTTLTGVNPCNDNTAIATDKIALNPGASAGVSNYISYSRGINGLMIDVSPGSGCSPLPAGPLAASNFDFKIGNSTTLGAYAAAAAPLSIDVTPGGGASGADRIKIIWADNAIPNRNWLRVLMKSTTNGGQLDLDLDNIFYFGVAMGESLTPGATRAVVNVTDEVDARNHPHSTFSRVPVATNSTYAVANAPDAKYDYDKSSTINPQDEIIARNNPTSSFNGLLLLNPAP